jgi:hypothetical protein
MMVSSDFAQLLALLPQDFSVDRLAAKIGEKPAESTLVMMGLAVAVPCSWLATEMKWAREQKALVEEIRKGGGLAYYDCQLSDREAQPAEAAWLGELLGDDFFPNTLPCTGRLKRL